MAKMTLSGGMDPRWISTVGNGTGVTKATGSVASRVASKAYAMATAKRTDGFDSNSKNYRTFMLGPGQWNATWTISGYGDDAEQNLTLAAKAAGLKEA